MLTALFKEVSESRPHMMIGMNFNTVFANDPDESGFSGSISMFMGPVFTVAIITVSGTVAWNTPAIAQTWISGFVVRQSDGSDLFVDTSNSAPNGISNPDVTRVDFFVSVYQANCTASARAEFWA